MKLREEYGDRGEKSSSFPSGDRIVKCKRWLGKGRSYNLTSPIREKSIACYCYPTYSLLCPTIRKNENGIVTDSLTSI